MQLSNRQKITILSQRIYVMTAWGAPKNKINTLITEYNQLADELNETATYEWAQYKHKELLK